VSKVAGNVPALAAGGKFISAKSNAERIASYKI